MCASASTWSRSSDLARKLPRSRISTPGTPARERHHATVLETAMVAEGFEPLDTEWWHFDGPNWREYELADRPLSDL